MECPWPELWCDVAPPAFCVADSGSPRVWLVHVSDCGLLLVDGADSDAPSHQPLVLVLLQAGALLFLQVGVLAAVRELLGEHLNHPCPLCPRS